MSVTPDNGATAVMPDATIVITFSEPMDKVATAAAYISVDLPADAVTFAWNGPGDELTITPDDPLAIAQGDEDVVALEYDFEITTDAEDLAGNALDFPFSSGFSTIRNVIVEIPTVGNLSGYVNATGYSNISNDFKAGDGPNNEWYRGLLSFSLSSVPDDIIEWNSATLFADQFLIQGDPYGGLQDVRVHEDSFAAVDLDAATSYGADLGEISTDAALEFKTLDITDSVQTDVEANETYTQYLMRFEISTNGDTELAVASFEDDTTYLEVDVMVE